MKWLNKFLDAGVKERLRGARAKAAADPVRGSGMTLSELDTFVHHALSMGAHPDHVVMHRCNPDGTVRQVWIDGDGD